VLFRPDVNFIEKESRQMMGKDNNFFDSSLARGVRRFKSNSHKQHIFGNEEIKFNRVKSFEGNARRVVQHYQETFGADCVHVYRLNSKVVSMLNVFHMPDGFSMALIHEVYKKKVYSGQADQQDLKDRFTNYVPIFMTAHFVERFIQSSVGSRKTIASLTYDLWRAIQTEMYAAVTGADEMYPKWNRTGEFAFATPEFLVLGKMPLDEDLVCQTVIRVDRLESAKVRLWELARQQPNAVLVKQA